MHSSYRLQFNSQLTPQGVTEEREDKQQLQEDDFPTPINNLPVTPQAHRPTGITPQSSLPAMHSYTC